jgi:predicted DNA-binding protein
VVTRTGKLLNVYLPPELTARLEESAKRSHRTKTAQVILALEQYLAQGEDTPAKPKRGRKGK